MYSNYDTFISLHVYRKQRLYARPPDRELDGALEQRPTLTEFDRRQHLPSSEPPMSRGFGELQRRLLVALREHERKHHNGLATPELARRVHGREPTRSELVSIRRALARLMERGEVDRSYTHTDHAYRWRRTR
jgi:hypothetical protein